MSTAPRAALAAIAAAISFATTTARGADWYVDPKSGSMSNDGSASSPWQTLEQVISQNLIESQGWQSLPWTEGATLVVKNAGAPVKAGDTIWLRSGYHGKPQITGYYNAQPITIAAEPGHTPELGSVLIRAGKNWKLSGLTLSPELAPTYEVATLIDLESHDWQGPISDIVVEKCKLYSKADVGAWSATDWDQLSVNGIAADGSQITIRENQLKNVNFGISVSASSSLIEKNVIDSFAGDGLRGLGDDTTFQYNVVKNCYDVNENHDDGFQSWSVGPSGVGSGQVKGIVLRGNLIMNYEDPNQPFRGTLQGIGCFDGMFVDWVIENNVIITDHWHGITLLGAESSRIVNNTVIDRNDVDPGPPWIRIAEHKNGTAPVGCVVRNNLTTALSLADTGVTEDHNLVIEDPAALFVDPAAFDLHLLPGSAAVDTGSSELAPSADIEGIPRPQGSGIDIGAYEWHDGSVEPDGGLGGASGGAGVGGSGASTAGTGGSGAQAGTSGGGGSAGAGAGSEDDGGCGCRAVGRAPARAGWLLLALALAALRRRRS